jgi:hypothetical protein
MADASNTIVPDYSRYPEFALGNAIAHLITDVREGKNLPHSPRMLDAAVRVLNERVAALKPPVTSG